MNTANKTRSNPTQSLPPGLDREQLMQLFEKMVLLRQFELSAQEKCKTGEIKFVHLYIGEEATAVGVCAHLTSRDWITSTHRGHGHALAKGMDPKVLMAELYGKGTGCCEGRGGSMHLYDPKIGLFGTNGIVCGGNPSAVGAAISATVRKSGQVAVAFFGDGGSNSGSFHESINFAGVQHAPVVFVCENNLYATATPLTVATLNTDISSKAAAHGIPGVAVDGNDVVAVWQATKTAMDRARAGHGPTLIEARTYRTVGHHEGDPVTGSYRTQAEVDEWKKRDPIVAFRRRLTDEFGIATAAELDAIEQRFKAQMNEATQFSHASPEPDPARAHLHTWHDPLNPPMPPAPTGKPVVQGWLDAVRDGIAEEMRRDPNMIYLGEGIGERGGSFAHTKNLWKEFGGGRVIDTPISELGFTGAALGASATGCRAVADLMFIEFLFEAAGQVVLQAAKLRYMSNGQMSAPMVIRAASGAVRGAGPHHSGSYHPMWSHVPGLIVAMPSNAADAKGLMKTALRAYDPVIFLEPKSLFASKGEVPVGEHMVPFGQARIAREGTHLTIVAAGQIVILALEAAVLLEKEGVFCEVIDLRTLVPLDVDTIAASLTKTGHLLVADEGYSMCGIGAEIAQSMMELAFDELDGPIGRLHTDPVSHPVNATLEETIAITRDKIVTAAKSVIAGIAPVARRAKGTKASGPAAPAVALPPAPSKPSAPPVEAITPAAPAPPAPAAAAVPEGELLSMPHGDLTVTEATVVKWYKQVGDPVANGETVLDVETDKAVMAVDSAVAGVLVARLVPEGTIVKMGQGLAVIKPN
ncbi:MAG: dehydrogenase [Verrucomicrobia bacterium]|nr:dehydrogenase [Verrucomicrobiota bacterium]